MVVSAFSLDNISNEFWFNIYRVQKKNLYAFFF
jgi:hypothetical protein